MTSPFDAVAGCYQLGRHPLPEDLWILIQNYIGEKEIDVAIDIGCGTGESTVGAAKFANSAIGVDSSKKMVEIARKRHINATFLLDDGEHSAIQNESSDLVTFGSSLHWMNASSAVSESTRILKRGGICAIWWVLFPELNEKLGMLIDRHMKLWNMKQFPKPGPIADIIQILESSNSFIDITQLEGRENALWEPENLLAFLDSTVFFKTYLSKIPFPEKYREKITREIHESGGDQFKVGFEVKGLLARKK